MSEQARQSQAVNQVMEFLRWWKYELSLLQPNWLTTLRYGNKKRTSVCFEDERVTVVREQRGDAHAKREIYDDEGDLVKALRKRRKAADSDLLGLRLSSDQYFKRDVTLPSSARFKIDHILSLDLERSTPFKLGGIYTDHLIEKEEDNTLHITQFIVKRSYVDEPLNFMQVNGISPDFADAEKENGDGYYPVNFLDDQQKASSQGGNSLSFNGLLAIVLFVICFLFIYTAIDRQQIARAELTSKIQVERKKAQIISAKRNRENKQQALFRQLYEKKFKTPSTLDIWEELTRRLPDTAWVVELRINGDHVQITGFADKAEKLLKTLDQSPSFDEVNFFSPVTMDRNRKKERYRIKFKLRKSDGKGGKI